MLLRVGLAELILGGLILGVGLKLMVVFWLSWPNFADGIVIFLAGCLLVALALKSFFLKFAP